jgi:hypothetical protein
MILYLTDPRNEKAIAQARAILNPLHARLRGGWNHGVANPRVIVREAKYTFLELKRYRSKIDMDLMTTPGVYTMDLDEHINRLAIGVDKRRPEVVRDAVERILIRRGVPRDAVVYSLDEVTVLALRRDPRRRL